MVKYILQFDHANKRRELIVKYNNLLSSTPSVKLDGQRIRVVKQERVENECLSSLTHANREYKLDLETLLDNIKEIHLVHIPNTDTVEFAVYVGDVCVLDDKRFPASFDDAINKPTTGYAWEVLLLCVVLTIYFICCFFLWPIFFPLTILVAIFLVVYYSTKNGKEVVIDINPLLNSP